MEFNKMDMLALMPCPLKVPFDKKISIYLKEKKSQGIRLRCNVDANVNNHDALPNKEIFRNLMEKNSIEELPEIIFTTGLNSLFFSDFVNKFIGKNYFEDVLQDEYCKYSEYSYRDPKGEYTMFTMNPLVIVANLNTIGGLPEPEKWGDLLNEHFQNKIVIRGNKNMYCETVLLSLYKDYGIESMEKLSKNLKVGLHPAEMVKEIMSRKKDAASVYVMPYFFAKKINKKNAKIIWPEEGALANPVSMLVKKSASEDVKNLARFIVGKEMGQLFTDASFPVLNNEVDNKEFENKKFKWLGWEMIDNSKLGDTVKTMNRYFLDGGSIEEIERYGK